jgi:hypothetical protein
MILGGSALFILIYKGVLMQEYPSKNAAFEMLPFNCGLPKPINIKHFILVSVDVSWRRLQDIRAAVLLLSFSDLRP